MMLIPKEMFIILNLRRLALTLSFLCLSPIPELKLTDQGLIDAVNLKKTGLFV